MSDADQSVPSGTVVRNGARQRACLVLGGLSAAVAVMWLVSAFVFPRPGAHIEMMVIFLAVAAYAYYSSRACVVVSESAVTVRNPLRRATVPTDQVSGFDVESHFTGQTGNRTSVVWLRRTTGKSVRCMGASSLSNYRECVKAAQRLNAALGRADRPMLGSRHAQQALVDAQNYAAGLGKTPQELTAEEWDGFMRERGAGS